jgi:thiol-disulfide isomerase/thioredoxin
LIPVFWLTWITIIKHYLVLILFCISSSSWAQENMTHTLVGKSVPRFEGKTLAGNIFKLADHIGEPIVIDFWSTKCKPCLMELPAFEKLENEFKDLIVVSVTIDPKDVLDSFLANENGSYKLIKTQLKDTKMSEPVLYEAWDIADLFIDKTYSNWYDYQMGWPQKYFVDHKGIVQYYTLGYGASLGSGPVGDTEAIKDFSNKVYDEEAQYEYLKQFVLEIMNE